MRLANVYRGGHLESCHRGSIAVVDSLGRLLAFAGDPAFVTCIRSAAKPFQALPLLEYGGEEEYDLTGEEIAITARRVVTFHASQKLKAAVSRATER